MSVEGQEISGVLDDDVLSNDSFELDEDDDMDYSSEELDDCDLDQDMESNSTKKVAGIMGKILAGESKDVAILSKAKVKQEPEDSKDSKRLERAKIKLEMLKRGHTTPQRYDPTGKEKKLRIVATQGIIQLFRAVDEYRIGLSKELEAAKITSEKEKVYEKKGIESFMNLLNKSGEKIKTEFDDKIKTEVKEEVKQEIKRGDTKSSWKVFAKNYYEEPALAGWDEKDSDDDT